MNWLDLLIILLWLGALTRGVEVGMVRQLGSTVGFFGGLFAGAFIGNKVLPGLVHTASSRTLLSLILTFGGAFLFSSLGEYAGALAKRKILQQRQVDKIDRGLGAALGAATLLIAVWLGASFLQNAPSDFVQKQVRTSSIVGQLNETLPPAPGIISKIGHIIEPNGFPDVFAGREPTIDTDAPLPSIGDLDAAVQKTRASVVRIEGKGCGGIVEGSGFVAASGLVVTNAHVVAGVAQPTVVDGNGTHDARVVRFNPDLDLAVLHVSGLRGHPLALQEQTAANSSTAAILGYPGGGPFSAEPAAILDSFVAVGRNIYNQGETKRDVYSIKGKVVPGNSGGPLINQDGSVIGVIFAQSTTYESVGYALTMPQVLHELEQAKPQTAAVSSGTCAE